MHYIYGPIPSRRLGRSLGVDPVPLKTCNWNCVYCQLGRTVPLTNARREYVPRDALVAELARTLAAHAPGEIDYISFVGSGEPTLHSSLGWMLQRAKDLAARAHVGLPVAVITNGSLLYRPDVRQELLVADVVMPTLVAGSARLYKRINRPHPEVTFARIVDGLRHFRADYGGQLWVEVMLIQGMNDTEPALRELAAVLAQVQPQEVHITLPTRPPSETWVAPPNHDGLMRAEAILGDIAHVVHPENGDFDLGGFDSVVDAVIAVITRHPMSQNQLEQALARWSPDEVSSALAQLARDGRAQVVMRLGTRFWAADRSHFPGDAQSRQSAPGRSRTPAQLLHD